MIARFVFVLSLLLHCLGGWGFAAPPPFSGVWEDIHPEVRRLHFEHPEKLDEEVLRLLHGIVREVGGRLIVHSDHRQAEDEARSVTINSMHTLGKAVDFRLDNYGGLSRLERLEIYYRKTLLIEDFLKKYDIFDRVGLGIYPYTWNPFWHIDTRGRKARWCQNREKSYVGYTSCKKELEREFKDVKPQPTLRILLPRRWGFDRDSEILF